MGRSYDAAVMSAGHVGLALGATPTAIANRTAVTKSLGIWIRRSYFTVFTLLWLWGYSQSSHAQIGAESASPAVVDYRGGSVRLGAFAIDGLKSRLYFGPEDSRVGLRSDLEKDLGLKDSFTAFRASLAYRINRRHGFNAGFYKLSLDGVKNLSTTIELGDEEFEVGVDVASEYDERIVKLAYNYIFHDDGKVMLSIAPGIHFTDIDFRIATQNSLIEQTEAASTIAPLPVLGGRLLYRITPRLNMVVSGDVFFLNQSEQQGSLTDLYVVFEHQTFERVGFGGGLNRFTLDVELIDDGRLCDLESAYTGAYLFMTVRF
jgi:hypothetical protein